MIISYNNLKLNAFQKSNLYEFIKSIFYEKIPHFCYNTRLPVSGNCRLCLVEVPGLTKPIVSCSLLITSNLNIYSKTPFVKKARENVLEFLLTSHPLDCPICDQGGECDLQELSYYYGSGSSRFFHSKKNKYSIGLNQGIRTSMNRCILCTKCIRASFIYGISTLHAILRSHSTKIEIFNFSEKPRYSLNLVDICPVFQLVVIKGL